MTLSTLTLFFHSLHFRPFLNMKSELETYAAKSFFEVGCYVLSASSLPLPRCPYIRALSSLVWGMHLMSRVSSPFKQIEVEGSLSHYLFLTHNLPPLDIRRSVISLFIFLWYIYTELCLQPICISLPLLRARCIRIFTGDLPFSNQSPYARVNQHLNSFISFSCRLWSSFPLSFSLKKKRDTSLSETGNLFWLLFFRSSFCQLFWFALLVCCKLEL